MKTLLIIMISLSMSLGASAQRKSIGGYHHAPNTHIFISSFGYRPVFFNPYFGFGYPYFVSPYFGYPYYASPYYNVRRMPYKLSLQIASIKNDYKGRIKDTRHDKTLSGTQRRQQIRTLKNERDQSVINAQINFRSSQMNDHNPDMNNQNYRNQNYQNNQNQNNRNPGKSDSSSGGNS